MSSSEALRHYAELMGLDWEIDDSIPPGHIYAYDPTRYLLIRVGDFCTKAISMYDKDEVVIKIKKVD